MHITTGIIVTHIIAFATGYYLCYRNCTCEGTWLDHGIEQVRPQPQTEDLEYLEE